MDNPNPERRTIRPRLTVEEAEAAPLATRIFEAIRDIRDPEHPHSLEELSVIDLESVTVCEPGQASYGVTTVQVTPTVPHCSMAAIIGLCIRAKLQDAPPSRRVLPLGYKLDIKIEEGTHVNADEITKQLNDKERVAAALENPILRHRVMECIVESSEFIAFEG
mmetsp:Transcript_9669/g.19738  ORF Transcript_9669/g.19738 Transcript_9669/m.19738 type:complete len:164 (-) Transcript_9669:1991-2482(-)